MSPGQISKRVVSDRLAWVEQMAAEIRALPLDDRQAFFADRRNLWAAESCLRRGLEALLDLGRHILSKGFGVGTSEYREIAIGLADRGVFSGEDAVLLRTLAGYRNRLVHFYHEVEADELYDICVNHLGDLERVVQVYQGWLKEHKEWLNETL